MKSGFKDAIFYSRTLTDNLPGEDETVDIPGSTSEEVKDEYTREEALRVGATIDLCFRNNSGIPEEAQIERFSQSYFMGRIQANGYWKHNNDLYVPSQETIREREVAQSLGMTCAVETYELCPQESMTPCISYADILETACEKAVSPIQPQTVKSLPPAPLKSKPIAMPDKVERKSYVKLLNRCNHRDFEKELYYAISNYLPIKNCEGVIYCYDTSQRLYRKYTDTELKQLIHKHFGLAILENGRLDKTYDSMAKLIHVDSDFLFRPEKYPSPFLWPFWNGIVNIETGTIYENNGHYFNTYCIQCDYVPGEDCPNFSKFLEAAAMNDERIIQLMWETIGYILSPDVDAKKFFVFSGVRDSGKSLLANTLVNLVGQSNTSSLSVHDFSKNFSMCDLIGKQLNVSMDLPNTTLIKENMAQLKMLTGNDPIRADIKHQDPVSFYNRAKLLFGTNYSIRPAENDSAFLDRMVSIPFRYSVPKESQDPQLLRKFEHEYSGIANHAIRAYLQLKRRNLAFTNIYDGSDDPALMPPQMIDYGAVFSDAFEACFELTGRKDDIVTSEDAYEAYKGFCSAVMTEPEPRNTFSTRLHQLGVGKLKKTINGRSLQAFSGIKLK